MSTNSISTKTDLAKHGDKSPPSRRNSNCFGIWGLYRFGHNESKFLRVERSGICLWFRSTMIVYKGGGLGDFEVLTRIHGSAAYKAFPLAVISTGILFSYAFVDFAGEQNFIERLKFFDTVIDHPYPIGVFVSFFR